MKQTPIHRKKGLKCIKQWLSNIKHHTKKWQWYLRYKKQMRWALILLGFLFWEFPGCKRRWGKLGKIQCIPWIYKTELGVRGDHHNSQDSSGEENTTKNVSPRDLLRIFLEYTAENQLVYPYKETTTCHKRTICKDYREQYLHLTKDME